MSTIDDSVTPWWLRGNFAPTEAETSAEGLEVTGTIPPGLDGLFVRNGPNPPAGSSSHWFFGHGMLHGVRLRDGRAAWYRSRYVQTPHLTDPGRPFVDEQGRIDRTYSSANTHIVCHAGRLLALEEAHFPYEVDGELATVGPHDFDGRLTTAMTAHPKVCPETGEMFFFGYGALPPLLTYHRVDAAGTLVQSTEIPVPGPTMHHDFNVTRNHVIFMDLPMVFDLGLAIAGTLPYRWDDDYGARLLVMPRDGSASELRTFDIDPCYVFHPVNAWEEGDEIVIDTAWRDRMGEVGQEKPTLHRWRLDLRTGTSREETLDDRMIEFGRVHDSRVGLAHRHAVAAVLQPGPDPTFDAVIHYDMQTGRSVTHSFGPGTSVSEAVFAADPDDPVEGRGWVLTYVHDAATDRTSLAILDAADVTAEPVATVRLPVRVPHGFHGSWVPATALPSLA